MCTKYTNRFRNLIAFLLTSAIIVVALVYFSTTNNNINYRVHFYENDQLITTVTKRGNETVSHSDLMHVQSILDTRITGYDIGWLYSEDELFFVDFKDIHIDTNVYLYKTLHEYECKLQVDKNLEIIDILKDEFKHGSDYQFKVQKDNEITNQDIVVTVNNQTIHPNDEGIYTIKNITSNLKINVYFANVVNVDISQHEITYTGQLSDINLNYSDSVDIPLSDFEITYYIDEELTKTVEPINVGSYYVLIHYTGSAYYINDSITTLDIIKAVPNIEANDVEYVYDGNTHIYDKDNVITNSDGSVIISGTSAKEPGVYEVTISVSETENYEAISVTKKLTIMKMKPEIISLPTIGYVFTSQLLNEIDLSKAVANIPGTFSFVNETDYPKANVKDYQIIFKPLDNVYYQDIITTIELDVITQEMTFDVIANKKTEIFTNYQGINIQEISTLPVVDETFDTPIYWYSNSSIIGIDEFGNISILDCEGTFNIELYAIIRLGNTAEYCTLNYQIVNEEKTDLEYEESVPEDIDEIKVDVELEIPTEANATVDIVVSFIPTTSEIEIVSYYQIDNNKETQKELLEKESTNNYHYEAKAIFSQAISEVILWKILSSEPIDDNASYNANLNFNIYQKIVEKEKTNE